MKRVHVIGGGFSGLILAYFLINEGFPVEVFEKRLQLGGMISSPRTPHGLVETAAHSFLNSRLIEEVAKDIGVELLPAMKTATKRFIFRDGRARRWPLGVAASLRVVGAFGLYFLFRAMLRPTPHETVEQWGARVIGDEATRLLLIPVLSGIYAGDAGRLSATLVLGPVFSVKKNPRPRVRGSVSPRGGMGKFIQALAAKLSEAGVAIHCGKMCDPLESGVLSIFCGSGVDASGLSQPIEMLPLVSATLFFPRESSVTEGFGTLFPATEGFWSLGVLYNHCIFEGRVEDPEMIASETWIAGGALNPSAATLSDSEILEKLLSDRARNLRVDSSVRPLSFVITKWERAVPHYTVELEKLIETGCFRPAKGQERFFFGNYQGALGLSKIAQRAKDFARELKEASS